MMKLGVLAILGVSWLLVSNPASAADIVRFNATGIFTDGATLSGSLEINTVQGQVVSTDLFVSTIGSVDNLVYPHVNYADGAYEFFSSSTIPGFYGYFSGVFTSTSLVGFTGGDLASLSHGAQSSDGSYDTISSYYSYDHNGGLTSGSLSAVPEPAAWLMMIVGLGGAGMTMRRRSKLCTTNSSESGPARVN